MAEMRGSIDQEPTPAGGKKKALLIAVQDVGIPGFPKLRNAHRNAEDLRKLLIDVFGYAEANIVLMKDLKSIPKDLWPTKGRIRKQIRLFVKDVSAGDHLFFYYSGHGRQVICNHHSETDGLDEEICTCGGGRIMDNDLKRWLVNPLPCGSKLFALWDSCHSDTILDLDHHKCNEPRGDGYHRRLRRREPSPVSRFWQVFWQPIRFLGRNDLTAAPAVTRGRPRTRVTLTAVSAGSSPVLSRWTPFTVESIQRVLSPASWLTCDGSCELPPGDTDRAYVVSLSACKDSELAYDDEANNGSVTKFFVDHLREKPQSTLLELLDAIRARVNMISEARRDLDMQTKVISRRSTFAVGTTPKPSCHWPVIHRRETEVNVHSLDELLRAAISTTHEEVSSEDCSAKYSQKPGYSSHYRLNLDELVDL